MPPPPLSHTLPCSSNNLGRSGGGHSGREESGERGEGIEGRYSYTAVAAEQAGNTNMTKEKKGSQVFEEGGKNPQAYAKRFFSNQLFLQFIKKIYAGCHFHP